MSTSSKKRRVRRSPKELKLARIPRPLNFRGTLLPSTTTVNLGFSAVYALSAAASPYYAYPFYTNAPYDVDPAVGTSATQGLSQMAAMYSYMRVIRYYGTCQVISNHDSPVAVTLLHSNTSTGVTAGGANVDLTPYCNNPLAQTHMVGHVQSGSSTHTFKFSHPITRVVGSEAPLLEENYASTTATLPSETTYLLIGFYRPSGNLANAMTTHLRINFEIQFYDRKNLA